MPLPINHVPAQGRDNAAPTAAERRRMPIAAMSENEQRPGCEYAQALGQEAMSAAWIAAKSRTDLCGLQ